MRRKSSRISNKENRSSRLSLQQQNWQIPYNFDNFVEPLKEDAVVAIHNTAMKILEEIGVLFLNPEACKILKKAGCKVIGLAGSEEKCNWLVNDLGFDHAINYKTDDLDESLKNLCPDGVDIYFDNVAGDILDTVLQKIGRASCRERV